MEKRGGDRFRTCCKAKAFAKSWAESMCRTWNRPVAPCPGPPLLACFADRWTVISAPPSRSQRGIGMGAPHPARAERYDTPPHTQQRLSRSGWPQKAWVEKVRRNERMAIASWDRPEKAEHNGDRGALALVRNERGQRCLQILHSKSQLSLSGQHTCLVVLGSLLVAYPIFCAI